MLNSKAIFVLKIVKGIKFHNHQYPGKQGSLDINCRVIHTVGIELLYL